MPEQKWGARFGPYVYGPSRTEHNPAKWLRRYAPRDRAELAEALAIRVQAFQRRLNAAEAAVELPAEAGIMWSGLLC